MKLHVLKGTDAGSSLEPNPAGFTVGRGQDNDLVLSEEGTSRHHCRIEEKPEGWLVEDLGSMNGVRLNGQRIQDRKSLQDGDVIEVCGHEMRVDLQGSAPPPPAVVPQPETPPPPAVVPQPEAQPPPAVAPQPGAQPPPEGMPKEGRADLPWGRISLLAGMCMLIAALAFLLLTGPDAKTKEEQASEDGESTVESTEGTLASLGAVSDQELEKLIDDQEKLDAAEGVADPVQPPPAGTTGEATATAGEATATAVPTVTRTEPTQGTGPTDMVLVRSKPVGATVLIDEVEKGTTPAIITGLAQGRHRVTLKLPGYHDHQRLIHVPDVPARTPYLLRQQPNTLHVGSDPAGVSVWRGSQWLGVTPVLLRELPAGEVSLTLAMAGCPPRREKVTISAVRGEQLHVEMKPKLGDLTIKTSPPGCRVLVDGLLMGATRSETAGPGATGTLPVPNLLVGERLVQIDHPCGAQSSRKLLITAGGNLEHAARLWVPDTHVVLLDGTVKKGMLIERDEKGDIVLALSPRSKDMVRYLKPRVRAERVLSEAEAQETFQDVIKPGGADATKRDGKRAAGGDERWGDEADPENPLDDAPAKPGRDGDQPRVKREVLEFTELKLTEAIVKDTKIGFLKRHRGTTFQVTGRPSSIRRDGLTGVVRFGRRIRCEFDRKVFEKERKKLAGIKTPLTIQGRVKDFDGDRLIISECKPVYAPEGDN